MGISQETCNDNVANQLKALVIDQDEDTASDQKTKRSSKMGIIWLMAGFVLCGTGLALIGTGGATKYQEVMTGAKALYSPEKTVIAEAKISTPKPENKSIEVAAVDSRATVSQKKMPPLAAQSVVGSGYVIAKQSTEIKTQVPGQISSISVDVGDTFRKGDELLHLDNKAQKIALYIADLTVKKTEVDLAKRKAEYAEAKRLDNRVKLKVSKDISPKAQLPLSEQTVLLAGYQVALAERAMEIAKFNLKKTQSDSKHYIIRAPFDGVVVRRDAQEGDLVGSVISAGDADPILTIINPKSLIIEADVSETDIAQIFIGQSAEVILDAYPEQRIAATVTSIGHQVSVQKGTVTVRLRFNTRPIGVLANMSAKLEFQPKTAENLTLERKNHDRPSNS